MERGDIQTWRLAPKSMCMSWLYRFSPGQRKAIISNALAKKAGKYKTRLARSSIIDDIDSQKLVKAGKKGITMKIPMVSSVDRFSPWSRSIDMTVNIKWEPAPSNADDDM